MIADIYNENGEPVNRVVASASWLNEHYPNRWAAVEMPKVTLSLDQVKERKKEEVTNYRWAQETSGIELNGVKLLTDITDQDRIANAVVSGVEPIDFKTPMGWTTITHEEIKGIASLTGSYVQQCFSAERLHHEAIDLLGSVEEVESYDYTVNWPSKVKNNG